MNFHQRKKIRTDRYFRYEFKNKLVTCTACMGSGWYDGCDSNGNSIRCGCCGGLGKCRQR